MPSAAIIDSSSRHPSAIPPDLRRVRGKCLDLDMARREGRTRDVSRIIKEMDQELEEIEQEKEPESRFQIRLTWVPAIVLDEIREEGTNIPLAEVSHPPERVYVDDIDSFKKVKDIRPESVRGLVPLSVREADIKQSIADIIGERFIPKDWGGEKSDLYSTYVILGGKRASTAFMLKGPSVKRLTIAQCGKNGDQLLRLTREPARLFVVQSVGEIVTDVIDLLNTLASEKGRGTNEKLYYCIVDGVDTARILRAYGKL